MKKRQMMVTIALVLGLVLLIGFQALAASGARHKANKHLAAKTPVQMDAYKPDKHLADKAIVSAQGMALVGHSPAGAYALAGWGVMAMGLVGALLAPWTMEQISGVREMIRCARKSSCC